MQADRAGGEGRGAGKLDSKQRLCQKAAQAAQSIAEPITAQKSSHATRGRTLHEHRGPKKRAPSPTPTEATQWEDEGGAPDEIYEPDEGDLGADLDGDALALHGQERLEVRVVERQRFYPFLGWSSRLLPIDPAPWTTAEGDALAASMWDLEPDQVERRLRSRACAWGARGWQAGEWRYGFDFAALQTPRNAPGKASFARQRVHRRTCVCLVEREPVALVARSPSAVAASAPGTEGAGIGSAADLREVLDSVVRESEVVLRAKDAEIRRLRQELEHAQQRSQSVMRAAANAMLPIEPDEVDQAAGCAEPGGENEKAQPHLGDSACSAGSSPSNNRDRSASASNRLGRRGSSSWSSRESCALVSALNAQVASGVLSIDEYVLALSGLVDDASELELASSQDLSVEQLDLTSPRSSPV